MTATVATTQNTGAELVLYPHNLEPIALKPKGSAGEPIGADPTWAQLVSVTTSKALGAAGRWAAVVKVPRSRVRDFEESVTDGDWVDIVLQRNGVRTHVLRGIVEQVDPVAQVGGQGADTLAFQVSGADHQAVFEQTAIWFSTYSEENLAGGAALRAAVLTGRLFGLGGVRETVSGMLFGFLTELNRYGRALWQLPPSMPGGGAAFAARCARLFDPRVDDAPRVATGASLLAFEASNPWLLAAEWCDPQFNELWCDLGRRAPRSSVVAGDLMDGLGDSAPYEPYMLREVDTLEPSETQMAVFLRRRPFPTAEAREGLEHGPWSRLPTAIIQPQEVVSLPLHRGGAERVNVIEVFPSTVQEIAAQSLSLLSPLVDREDVARRGVRLLSLRSRYHADLPKGVSDQALAESQRKMLRDWHCLNPRFLSGTMALATLRPGIRVGTVACITHNPERLRGREAKDDLTFYVEEVRQSWRAPGTGRTELGVTRGFRGGDDAHLAALAQARARFTELQPSRTAAGRGTG